MAACSAERTHARRARILFASNQVAFWRLGAGGGVGLPLIGGILGHRQASTTQRYAYLADTPLRAAADVIGSEIAPSLAQASKAEPEPQWQASQLELL